MSKFKLVKEVEILTTKKVNTFILELSEKEAAIIALMLGNFSIPYLQKCTGIGNTFQEFYDEISYSYPGGYEIGLESNFSRKIDSICEYLKRHNLSGEK